LHIEEEEN
jgi:hypothetical protein